ncbi:hypothetical protein [Pseudomonas viridiflava]|uniref:hypothetical protein n=1 Tax=Pseudomonas viridiflava TaxID=33069 RepID=UPI002EAE081E|nr:hypothetical protein [Pseudomonas viridiflava]
MSSFKKPSSFLRPPVFFKLVASIKSLKKRNLLRGYASQELRLKTAIDDIRRGNTIDDIMTIGSVLKGPEGLIAGEIKKTSSDLFRFTTLLPLHWQEEVQYTCGYLNSARDDCIAALHHMAQLARIETIDTDDALERIYSMSKIYGASNYLSYKLGYIRVSRQLTAPQLAKISDIEGEMGHKEKSAFHFSALENLSPRISLFLIAQRRVSALVGKVDGDIRKSYTISNFIPTPLDDEDLAKFLLRATESSLVDTLHALIVVLNLNVFKRQAKELETRLHQDIWTELKVVIDESIKGRDELLITEHYLDNDEENDRSLDLYRISSCFLERPHLTELRNEIDCVIGARLLAEIIKNVNFGHRDFFDDKDALLGSDGTVVRTHPVVKLESFYRTFLFLRFIEQRTNLLALSDEDIKYIFEQTLALEILLTEAELRSIYSIVPDETQKFVAVLALALFRKKSIDPDVDYEFRSDLIDHVKTNYDGSILSFIDDLVTDSPQIASYIADSLDEVTIEKLYEVIKSSSQASEIRRDILKLIGQKLGRIEYLIEADSIETRSKLATLQSYFDGSRMYVDSFAMKKWLDGNPSVSTEQFRTSYPSIQATLRTIENKAGESKDIYFITLNEQSEGMIAQIAKDAFDQFCLNTEFGIESYLGRRIRHNTLDGVMTKSVDAIFNKSDYRMIMSGQSMKRTADSWLSQFRTIIDKLRKERLQFKSPTSLFNSVLDLEDSATRENIRLLSSSLRVAGSQLLNDLVISFCWKQISPQLENAARHIKTELLQEATSSIGKHFSGSFGSVEEQLKIELHGAVSGVFMKVADWFRVPQTGFISASVKELCEIILYDLNRPQAVDYTGGALENRYTGISVHRLYDCVAVLLQNALIHGEEGHKVNVCVTANKAETNQILDVVTVEITSIVASEQYENSKLRIERAIRSIEGGIDMVTEGYTGIKKVKFITQKSEGIHTLKCASDDGDRSLKLSFTLHSETASEDNAGGAL